ncbi:MAG: hypothetical protein ACOC6Q_01750 [Patescibacteria group bacterium]
MKILSSLTEKLFDMFFSAIGFRDPLVDDDSAILPYIKQTLQETSYVDLSIGKRNFGRNWEHAVRYFGKRYVIKYVSPEPWEVMKNWLARLSKQKDLLEKYLGQFLPSFEYFLVPVFPEKAAYVIVMERVFGKSLLTMSEEEIFSKPARKNLLSFLQANSALREKEGLFADLVGGKPTKILNPRFTGNLWVTNEGKVRLVDTVLIPKKYNSHSIPKKYWTCGIYHRVYKTLVLPRERKFTRKLANL